MSDSRDSQGNTKSTEALNKPVVHSLTPVGLSEIWPHEAHDFTPWLEKNISSLGSLLNINLESIQREVTLSGAGRVDLQAHQLETGNIILIENQYGDSDDSHCLRLLGYAANAKADILIWVASGFTPYHRSIIEWLNTVSSIHIYGVEVRTYRVDGSYAADFHIVVEPARSRSRQHNINTQFGEFYRPLVARLRDNNIHTVKRGGWRGRWRSFESGYSNILFTTELDEGTARVALRLQSPNHPRWYEILSQSRSEIDLKFKNPSSPIWGQTKDESLITLEHTEAASLNDPETKIDATRNWMIKNLVRLHHVLLPHLKGLDGSSEKG